MKTAETKTLLLLKDGEPAGSISVTLEREGVKCSLTTDCVKLIDKRYVASDFFRAFAELREDLSNLCYVPAVYGAHIDVFPGGLASDSSDGLVAYRFGAPQEKSLVKIFEEVPAAEYDSLASYEEQKARRKRLIHSARKRM